MGKLTQAANRCAHGMDRRRASESELEEGPPIDVEDADSDRGNVEGGREDALDAERRELLAGRVALALERSASEVEIIASPRGSRIEAAAVAQAELVVDHDQELDLSAIPAKLHEQVPQQADSQADAGAGLLVDTGSADSVAFASPITSITISPVRDRAMTNTGLSGESLSNSPETLPAITSELRIQQSGGSSLSLQHSESAGAPAASIPSPERASKGTNELLANAARFNAASTTDENPTGFPGTPSASRLPSTSSVRSSLARAENVRSQAGSNASTPRQLMPVSTMAAHDASFVRRVEVSASEIMKDTPEPIASPIRIRGRSFQSQLKVPSLNFRRIRSSEAQAHLVSRVISFHELFATLDFRCHQASSPSPETHSRPSTRGLLSRGRTLSMTPRDRLRTKMQVMTTPRAQTARNHDKITDDGFFARSDEKLGYEPSALPVGTEIALFRRPTTVGMSSVRGNLTARDSSPLPRARTGGSPVGIQGTSSHHAHRFSDGLSGKGVNSLPYAEIGNGSNSFRNSCIDSGPIGVGKTGLISVVSPRIRDKVITPRTARNAPDFPVLPPEVKRSIEDTLCSRKLSTGQAVDARLQTAVSDGQRRRECRHHWSRIERQARSLWKPKLPPHAIDEITAANPKARQKLALIRRFCEKTSHSGDGGDELMALFYRFMSRSEFDDAGDQVQGFLNLLVETGALKMYSTQPGLSKKGKMCEQDDMRVEDGILTRKEVFEIFRSMSTDLDVEEKPFSFDVIKRFMTRIQELVLHKLRAELNVLKAESLNPVSIRANQAASSGATGSLVEGEAAKQMLIQRHRTGTQASGNKPCSLKPGSLLVSSRQRCNPEVAQRPHPGSVRGGKIFRGVVPRNGPTRHVQQQRDLNSSVSARDCEDLPVRLYN